MKVGTQLLLALVALPQAASAQLFIMVRQDEVGVRASVDEYDGRAKLEARVKELGGDWALRTASNKCGYASVWVVARPSGGKNVPLRYFVADGYPTGDAAMRAAEKEAYAFKGTQSALGASSEGGIHLNRNKYSLQRLTHEMLTGSGTGCSNKPMTAIGVRG